MADIYLDVDAALSEVPVNLLPLLDDTDFKTREVAVAYNAAGMDLVWNFVTSAGAFTQTAVTPTTAGDYDWTHQGDGIYTIEIPASGGASINNDTEGYGWFTGIATGVLPWRGPVIGFRHSALNDSLCDTNTTGVLAPTTAGRTLDVTSTGEAGVDFDNILFSGNGPFAPFGIVDRGTAQAADATSITLRAGFSTAAANMVGKLIWVYSATNGLHTTGTITAYNNTSKVATVSDLGEAATGTVLYIIFATAVSSSSLPLPANVTQWNGSNVATPSVSGVPEVDITHFNGTAGTFSGGRPEVNTSHWGGTAVGSTEVRANLINIAGSAVNAAAAQLGVNVVNFGGSAGTFSGGRPEVNASHWGGTAVGSAAVRANLLQINSQGIGGAKPYDVAT